jgi:hypothetical protein
VCDSKQVVGSTKNKHMCVHKGYEMSMQNTHFIPLVHGWMCTSSVMVWAGCVAMSEWQAYQRMDMFTYTRGIK